MVLRHWRPGDRFHPIGAAQSLKLQDFFTNEKIPKAERRQRVIAVAADGQIFWVEGCRIADGFKLDKHTRSVLKWHWHSA
jgi:tRNA(Ile)-lysidine synthase